MRSATRSPVRARLLDVHTDADHNRSVFTLVGSEDELADALVAGVRVAAERIDLRAHDGAHPRIGAADVVPIVPLLGDDLERAQAAAALVGRRIGEELGLPVFVYAPPERGPAFYRRGGPAGLQRRIDAGELAPDYGPPRLHESAGGVILGARRPLIAFNVNLRGTLAVAREVAAVVREKGGGFPGVRALGLDLPRAGRRPGLDERRGLGGCGPARDRRAHRAGGARRVVPRSSAPSSSASCPRARRPPRRARCSGSTGSTQSHVLELRLLDD